MKTLIYFILSFTLTVLLLAPTIIVFENDQNSVVIEHNEDEKNKEEKKELGEDDTFLTSHFNPYVTTEDIFLNLSSSYLDYLEANYNTTLEIFLPPPKQTV